MKVKGRTLLFLRKAEREGGKRLDNVIERVELALILVNLVGEFGDRGNE